MEKKLPFFLFWRLIREGNKILLILFKSYIVKEQKENIYIV